MFSTLPRRTPNPFFNFVLLALFSMAVLPAVGQSVIMQHNDLKRTGWDPGETILTQANVSGGTFGKIFDRDIDDQVYAQPLVINHVSIGGGTHNIVIVCSVNNSVYAFDADDSATMNPYWHSNLTNDPVNYRPIKNYDMVGACAGNYLDFRSGMGIVGTPAIDTASHSIYVVSRSVTLNLPQVYVQYLHVLDLSTGADKVPPVYITASVPGTGEGGTVITFDQQRQNQRPALMLYNGILYIAWASHCDWVPYHGWVIGYDATTLQQKYVYNTTPNGGLGGIWMSGQGPAVDDDGFIYVTTGNGTTGSTGQPNDTINRASSLIKLSTASGQLKAVDFFTPADFEYQNDNDLDYGVDGAMIIPNSHMSLSGSKESYLYLIDNTAMKGATSDNNNAKQILDINVEYNGEKHIHGTPAYFKSDVGKEFIYAWAEGGLLKQMPLNRTTMQFDTLNKIVGNTALFPGMPGAFMSVTSNGFNPGTGILWSSHTLNGDANHETVPGMLQAYDATDVTHELWNSNMSGLRDSVGFFAKFVPPTIANGKVYLATFSKKLHVYGLNAPKASHCPFPLPNPWISADIGYVVLPGDVCYNNGTYTITAAGDDIINIADAFHSVFQPVPGSNVEIIARVVSMSVTDPYAKCGVMFRTSLDPGSPNVLMALTPAHGGNYQSRTDQNGITTLVGDGTIQPPYWVRIASDGNSYKGYDSQDGVTWHLAGTFTVALGVHPYVGLAYTSHNIAALGTAVLDNVTVVAHTDTSTVRLLEFTGSNVNNQYSQLNWTTGSENDFDHFEIEHSVSNTNFSKIGIVNGSGDSQFEQFYAFADNGPAEGTNYYRLKMVAKNGSFTYSNVVTINFSLAVIEIYPNPATNVIYLKNNVNFTNNEQLDVVLVDPLGQRIFTTSVATAGLMNIVVKFPVAVANGVYFLKAINSTGQKQAWKLQIQNP
jgi:Secretion system C-terminal sorting domain